MNREVQMKKILIAIALVIGLSTTANADNRIQYPNKCPDNWPGEEAKKQNPFKYGPEWIYCGSNKNIQLNPDVKLTYDYYYFTGKNYRKSISTYDGKTIVDVVDFYSATIKVANFHNDILGKQISISITGDANWVNFEYEFIVENKYNTKPNGPSICYEETYKFDRMEIIEKLFKDRHLNITPCMYFGSDANNNPLGYTWALLTQTPIHLAVMEF